MKGSSLLFVLVTLLLQNMLCPVAIAQSSVQQNSMTVSSDFLQKMPTEQLEAYFDSIYRLGHPHLDTILAEESTKPGKHPIKRQSTFSYSNNYVPSTASVSTQKAVGQIDIHAGISPSGAKTYTVPIMSYQHDGVFCPNLSLSYNSQAGGSYAGKGWSVGGLQFITRGSKSFHYDGKAEGIIMTPDDAFFLNGVRLIRISSTAYEYKSEQGNIRVVASVAGNITKNFTVYYPNGYKGVFGPSSTNYNRIEYPLQTLTDERGRQIKFTYNFYGNRYYLTKVQYDNLMAKIELTYDDTRADYIAGYRGGVALDSKKLLKTITCSRNNVTSGVYSLSYSTNDNMSLLTQIDYTANGISLNPLKFYYGDGSAQSAFETASQSYQRGYEYTSRSQLVGVRGRLDYHSGDDALFVYPAETPYLHVTAGGSTNTFSNKYDANGDIYAYCNLNELLAGLLPNLKMETGFIDLLCADLEGNQRELAIKVNNSVYNNYDRITFKVYVRNDVTGLSLYKTRTFDFSTLYTDGAGNKSIQPKFYYAGDFNGDGKMEILAVSAENPLGESTRPSKCYIFDLINGTKLYEGHVFSFHKEFPSSYDFINPENNSDKIFAIDVNGDGKTEICHVSSSGTSVYSFQSAGGTWSFSNIANGGALSTSSCSNSFFACGDFNGDGLIDVITSAPRSWSSTNWTVYHSKGDGSFTSKVIQGPNMNTSANSDFIVQDFDGDGITDLVELTSSDMKCYTIKNNAMTLRNTTSLPYTNEFIAPVSVNSSTLNYQFVGMYGYHASLFAYKTKQTIDQALTGVINSLGVIDKNYYYSISRDSYGIYSQYTTASFPYSNLYEGIPVLAGSEVFLNGASKDINKYYYENAVLHRQGMGFRGFEKIKSFNKRNQLSTTIYEPYNYSLLKSVETPTTKIDFTNAVTVNSDKTVKAVVSSKTEKDKLKNVTGTTNYTYDTYGLALTEKTTLPGSIEVNKAYSYLYNNHTDISTKYHLGVLSSSSVTTKRGSSQHQQTTIFSSYNSYDQPLTVVEKINNNTAQTTTYVYDSSGNMTSQSVKPYTSTAARTSNFIYETGNRMTKVTDPVGIYKSFTYNTDGTISKTTTYVGNTEYTYDDFGRQTKVKYPDNTEHSTSFAWDSGNGGLYAVTKTGTNMLTVKTVYDAFNREVKTITTRFDGTKTMVVKTYDAYGNMSQESLPYKSSNPIFKQYTYDSYNRLTKKVERGMTTNYSYSGLSTTSNDGTTSTTTTEDALGAVVSVANPAGTTTYTLNGAGNPTSIVTPGTSANVTTTISYDAYGRRTAINDPNHGTSTYEYDSAGNLKKTTDSNSKSISYLYDNYGRPTKKTSSEFYTTYTYNNNLNKLTAATSSNGTSTTYTYDNLGRLSSTQENGIDSKWLKKDYTYSSGRVSSLKYTSQSGELATENYTYANGYLKEVKLNGTTSIFKLTSENALGQATGVTTGGLSRTYNYTGIGYPLERSVTGGGQVYQNWTYAFNTSTGNLTNRRNIKNNITESFTYDNLKRLTNFAGTAVTYDNNGNITSKGDIGSYSYNSSKPFAVEEITLSNSITAGTENVSYFSFDRPNTITGNGYTVSYTYNGDYDKVKMKKMKNGSVILQRYYLGGCYEADVTSSGTKEKVYLNGDYYSAPAVLIKNGSSSSVYYILRDHLGSITHIVSSSGTVMQELSYDAWGRLRNPANNAAYAPASEPEPYLGRGYCGHEHLAGLGLINMNARLYDPLIGRFLSVDPYVQAPEHSQSFNRYSYCMNNPLKYNDITGELFGIDDLIIIGCVVVGAYLGGVAVNHNQWNPAKWNYSSFGTYAGLMGGGLLGGIAGGGIVAGSLGYTFGAITPFGAIHYNNWQNSNKQRNQNIEYDTVAGGHWSSSDKIMEENGEKAYNEAKESFGEYYSRNINETLDLNPHLNNLYIGTQNTINFVNISSSALKKTSNSPWLYNSLIRNTNILNATFIIEECVRDYYKDGKQIGFNLNKDLRKNIGSFIGGSVGGFVGGMVSPYTAIGAALFGSFFFSNTIEENAYQEYFRSLQPIGIPENAIYDFFIIY